MLDLPNRTRRRLLRFVLGEIESGRRIEDSAVSTFDLWSDIEGDPETERAAFQLLVIFLADLVARDWKRAGEAQAVYWIQQELAKLAAMDGPLAI